MTLIVFSFVTFATTKMAAEARVEVEEIGAGGGRGGGGVERRSEMRMGGEEGGEGWREMRKASK